MFLALSAVFVLLYLFVGFVVFGIWGGFAPPLPLVARLALVVFWPAFFVYAAFRPRSANRDLDDVH